MKPQAAPTKPHGLTPEQYSDFLARVRESASRTIPGVHITGLQMHGGVWHAVTSAGVVPVREIADAVREIKAGDNVVS